MEIENSWEKFRSDPKLRAWTFRIDGIFSHPSGLLSLPLYPHSLRPGTSNLEEPHSRTDPLAGIRVS